MLLWLLPMGAAYVARLRMLLTAVSDQGAPRALGTPRALSARATPRSVVTPLVCISLMIGMMFAAKRSALALLAAAPSACAVELFCTICPCCCHAAPKAFTVLRLLPNGRRHPAPHRNYHPCQ